LADFIRRGIISRPRISPREPNLADLSEKLIEPSGLTLPPEISNGTGSAEWAFIAQTVE